MLLGIEPGTLELQLGILLQNCYVVSPVPDLKFHKYYFRIKTSESVSLDCSYFTILFGYVCFNVKDTDFGFLVCRVELEPLHQRQSQFEDIHGVLLVSCKSALFKSCYFMGNSLDESFSKAF